MCSINGVVALREERISEDLQRRHQDIANALAYRGPDRQGHYCDERCCFYVNQHNVTLLEGNEQPVVSADGRIVMGLNGEVYNYHALNQRLKNLGRPVRNACDTETFLQMYDEFGHGCLDQISGMYALAVFETHPWRLFLARDRFGERPLFYVLKGDFLHFCSESNFLVQFTDGSISHDALLQFFSFGFAFDHLVDGVRRLQPGTSLTVDRNGVSVEEYWKPRFATNYALTEESAVDTVIEILERQVSTMRPTEVACGSYISGGIDSAIIASILSSTGGPTNLYTSGLTDLPLSQDQLPVDPDYIGVELAGNELQYADIVASRIGGKYHRRQFSVSEVVAHLGNMIGHLPGGPVMSTSFPLFYFSALESRHQKVAFAGEGSDELHGGYETANPVHYGGALARTFVRLSDYFSDEMITDLLGAGALGRLEDMCAQIDAEVARDAECDCRPEDLLFNRIRFLQLRYVFCPHLLEKADGMTMSTGPTELREPFLSREYAEFALSLPTGLCRNEKGRKFILIQAALKLGIPEEIVFRKHKQRTSLPYYSLFYRSEQFRSFVDSVLNKKSFLCDVIKLSDPGAFVNGLEGTLNAHKRAWSLLVLELWLRRVA